MKKRDYICDLKLEEILKRLDNGEKVYYKPLLGSGLVYYQNINGYLVKFVNDEAASIGDYINYNQFYYFSDDVAEADDSCIGKLCLFWDEDESTRSYEERIEILDKIREMPTDYPFATVSGETYNRCRPLTAEEVKKYLKED